MKRIVAACLCLSLAATAAMGADKALEKAKNSKTRNVTFILKNIYNPFCVSTRDGAMKGAAEKGINLTVLLPEEGDNNDQLLALTSKAVNSAEPPDVMIMFPADSYKFVPAVQTAYDADIPVIMLAANIIHDQRIYATFVAADNRLVGRTIGETLAKRLNYKGNVLLVEGVPGAQNSVDRMGGAAEALAKYPDIKIVASVPGLGRKGVTYRQAGRDVMTDILKSHPGVKIDGIFTMVDELALGCIEILEEQGKFGKDVVVAGCDGTKDAIASIKAGKMNFTCNIDPYNQGYQAMLAADKILAGEEVPPRIVTDLKIIDSTNVGN